jgi:hypothetical protein
VKLVPDSMSSPQGGELGVGLAQFSNETVKGGVTNHVVVGALASANRRNLTFVYKDLGHVRLRVEESSATNGSPRVLLAPG